jgi:hypothetical protein
MFSTELFGSQGGYYFAKDYLRRGVAVIDLQLLLALASEFWFIRNLTIMLANSLCCIANPKDEGDCLTPVAASSSTVLYYIAEALSL